MSLYASRMASSPARDKNCGRSAGGLEPNLSTLTRRKRRQIDVENVNKPIPDAPKELARLRKKNVVMKHEHDLL